MRLTKSRFTTALTCPTKLFYGADKQYANQSLDDSFLLALAEGGFQVGELAKQYFPAGVEVSALDEVEALAQSNRLLAQENVTIFEAAVRFKNCFIRIDILVKQGNRLTIYEVKAKSFDSSQRLPFIGRRSGKLASEWKKYIYDVAFQKWVVKAAFPAANVTANLMLTDKSKMTVAPGLNQKFRISTDDRGRKGIHVTKPLTDRERQSPVLTSVGVDSLCSDLYNSMDHGLGVAETFSEMVERFSEACEKHIYLSHPVSTECKTCEFRANPEQRVRGLRDGREECFQKKLGFGPEIFSAPTVLDLWNSKARTPLLQVGVVRLADVPEEALNVKAAADGLSQSERQCLQVQKVRNNDDSVYVDDVSLREEMNNWCFPLHFIDFETTAVALPFGKGRRPYEGIAFQFSHHRVDEDGTVTHADQFLCVERGIFPNYDFARALRSALEGDNGTIFRYSNHENTYLATIIRQLETDPKPPSDAADLILFLKAITHSTKNSVQKWNGPRDMVDLCDLVKKYFYDPRTNGSISIKHVLPAILSRSEFLKLKYSKSIYGAAGGIRSLNFTDWVWLAYDQKGEVIDPYERLPKLFDRIDTTQEELLIESDSLKSGGAALIAYARMQFDEMSDPEREELSQALLRYCELDTLAMVMIYEYWRYELLATKIGEGN